MTRLERPRHHVTGAIERGEAVAIAEIPDVESIRAERDKLRGVVAREMPANAELRAALRDIVTATSKEGSKPSAEIIAFCYETARAALVKVGAL